MILLDNIDFSWYVSPQKIAVKGRTHGLQEDEHWN
jgi:hypothetical protein